MMFGSNVILPDLSPSDLRGVMALLDLIHNSKVDHAKQFLEKLQKEKVEAVTAAAAAKDLKEGMVADIARVDALHKDMEERLTQAINEINVQKAALADQIAKAKEDGAAVENKRLTFETQRRQQNNEHGSREKQLLARENAVMAREDRVDRAEKELADKLERFKKLVEPLRQAGSL